MMPDTLEMLMNQLAGMKERAQHIAHAVLLDEYGEEVLDFQGENRIWLALEQSTDGGWCCSWLMKPDEATEPVIETTGRTPIEAALKLREKMEGG